MCGEARDDKQNEFPQEKGLMMKPAIMTRSEKLAGLSVRKGEVQPLLVTNSPLPRGWTEQGVEVHSPPPVQQELLGQTQQEGKYSGSHTGA